MKSRIIYIKTNSHDAAFHFAVEEYCMRHFSNDVTILMLWQTDPCAMLGAYQIADAEIDLALAEEKNIQIVRRSSGGGTIFTDRGTILFTVITPFKETDDAKQIQRELVAGPVIKALIDMGIPVKLEGRNDILLEGRKISGLAQRLSGDRLCSHGSILYDADLEMLGKLLTPDQGKIESHALHSNRSRVTNIIDCMEPKLTTEDFLLTLKRKLFEVDNIEEYTMSQSELDQIENIRREKYTNPSWIYGKNPRFTYHNEKRFPAGKLEAYVNVEKGIIASCHLYGDFLGVLPLRELEEKLETKPYQFNEVSEILRAIDLTKYTNGISVNQMLECLFGREREN
ncbi:MAG TPA: lipoate--protein ligase [Oscillospiraceae bacterium]|nr:lipoate--protein ligase [Oscillospiraceae bacterium]